MGRFVPTQQLLTDEKFDRQLKKSNKLHIFYPMCSKWVQLRWKKVCNISNFEKMSETNFLPSSVTVNVVKNADAF